MQIDFGSYGLGRYRLSHLHSFLDFIKEIDISRGGTGMPKQSFRCFLSYRISGSSGRSGFIHLPLAPA